MCNAVVADRGEQALTTTWRIADQSCYLAAMIEPPPSSWRKIAGITLIVAMIILWAALILIFAPFIGRWPVLVQAIFYLIMGVAWVVPLKPLLRWSETGSWRVAPAPGRPSRSD